MDIKQQITQKVLFYIFRDGFYELIREWEEYHMSPNWNMGEVLGHRIRGLVPYRTDLANLIHFARLFQSQLIAVRLFGSFIFMITNKIG